MRRLTSQTLREVEVLIQTVKISFEGIHPFGNPANYWSLPSSLASIASLEIGKHSSPLYLAYF
jgi:hypothetical protein